MKPTRAARQPLWPLFLLLVPPNLWLTHRAYDLQTNWGQLVPASVAELTEARAHVTSSSARTSPPSASEQPEAPHPGLGKPGALLMAAARPCECILRCPVDTSAGEGGQELFDQLCGRVLEVRAAAPDHWRSKKATLWESYWNALAEAVWWPEFSRWARVGGPGYAACVESSAPEAAATCGGSGASFAVGAEVTSKLCSAAGGGGALHSVLRRLGLCGAAPTGANGDGNGAGGDGGTATGAAAPDAEKASRLARHYDGRWMVGYLLLTAVLAMSVVRILLTARRVIGDALGLASAPFQLIAMLCSRCCDSFDDEIYYPEDPEAFPAVPAPQGRRGGYGDDDDDEDFYGYGNQYTEAFSAGRRAASSSWRYGSTRRAVPKTRGACRQISATQYAAQAESYTQRQLAELAQYVKEVEDDGGDGQTGTLASMRNDAEHPRSHFQIVRHMDDLRRAWALRRQGGGDDDTLSKLLQIESLAPGGAVLAAIVGITLFYVSVVASRVVQGMSPEGQPWQAALAMQYALLLALPLVTIIERALQRWVRGAVYVSGEALHIIIFAIGFLHKDTGLVFDYAGASDGNHLLEPASSDSWALFVLLFIGMLHGSSLRLNNLVPPFSVSFFAGLAFNMFLTYWTGVAERDGISMSLAFGRLFVQGIQNLGQCTLLGALGGALLLLLPLVTSLQWLALSVLSPSARKSFASTLLFFGTCFGFVSMLMAPSHNSEQRSYGSIYGGFVLANALAESALRSYTVQAFSRVASQQARRRVARFLGVMDFAVKALLLWILT